MKATLHFNLPEEREEFEAAQQGSKLKGGLQDFDNYLRGLLKYEQLTEDQIDILQKVRDNLHELCPYIW